MEEFIAICNSGNKRIRELKWLSKEGYLNEEQLMELEHIDNEIQKIQNLIDEELGKETGWY